MDSDPVPGVPIRPAPEPAAEPRPPVSAGAQVVDNTDLSRYELHYGGQLAGYAHYQLRGATMVLDHTLVEPAFEGRGVAGTLIRAALDAARSRGLRVDPACPFAASYIERHPEYKELVAG